jgi:hypothetical protein
MSIIVYRDGVMAADSACWVSDIVVNLQAKKARKLPNGYLVGCVGTVPDIQDFETWVAEGMKGKPPRDLGSIAALIAKPDGSLWRFSASERGKLYTAPVPYAVIGYGYEFAMGALAADKSARQAVSLAIKHCPYLGGRVHSVSLDILPNSRKRR